MALFTDADIVGLDDLLEFENTLVQISSTHNVDVSTKINLAVSDIGDKLMLWLLKAGRSDPQWLNRRLLGLSTIVVTSTLHRWLCFESLSLFFAEAYNLQLNTRFQAKWTEYQTKAAEAAEMVFMSGLGIVYNPLPQPAMPVVSVGIGTFLPEALFIQTAWVDKFGAESALSPVNGLVLQSPSSVSVTIQAAAGSPPTSATGWNVYASATSAGLTRQNAMPLASNTPWELPTSGLVSGPGPIDGQVPNFYSDFGQEDSTRLTMLPLTILAAQKISDLLTTRNALQEQILAAGTAANVAIPLITSAQILLSSASADICDKNIQLTYPRVCLYSSGLQNLQTEKFRTLSGTVETVAEIWASANMATDTDQWIHFYVEALTQLLRQNIGDWGDGFFFSGIYDVQFQPPKSGGLGFVQSAKVTCNLNVSGS